MKQLCILVLLLIFCTQPAQARPSFRSIREDAQGERYDASDPTQAGWYKQYFEPDGWGLRVTYPSSWNEPLFEPSGTSSDGTVPYVYVRLIPNNMGLGKRKNTSLELYGLRWDVGTQMTPEEVAAFAFEETMPRFREYWYKEEFASQVAGIPAWTHTFKSMTGHREETWFSQGRYLYTLGYRSRHDYLEDDHFFFEDMVNSAVVTPVAELKEVVEVTEVVEGAEVLDAKMIFADVDEDHPYAEAIAWAKETGTIGGYPDGTFQPNRTVNRVEFLKIVLELTDIDRSLRTVPFPDLQKDAWYIPYVANAQTLLIVEGYPDGTFKPERTVNVAEALKIAYSALGIRTSNIQSKPWYAKYYDHALAHDILLEQLDPGTEMQRKDVVWMVWRLQNS